MKAGFVALVGPPNVGKSTLVNRILGEKVSIVSPKPQTTRERVLGIVHTPSLEMVFVDTPGLHDSKGTKLNHFMNSVARSAMRDADVIALLVDVHPEEYDKPLHARITKSIAEAKKHKLPVVLVVNKVDRVRKPKLLPFIAQLQKEHAFAAILPISAKTGDGVELFITEVAKLLPEGERMFPNDQVTDLTERKAVSELVREQVFLQLEKELPYATAVVTDSFEETQTAKGNPLVRIRATIMVERDSQRGIMIGKGGSRLKEIGSLARAEIEKLLGVKVHLELHVKALEGWSDKTASLRELGYDEKVIE